MSKPGVVFFGSGPVAARSLEKLQKHFQVEAVITKPTTQHEMSVVAPGVPLFTAFNKESLDQLFARQTFKSPVAILIDFGIIISTGVIQSFNKGIINSHFSVLPEFRGADPITFAILSGQESTGVSIMQLVEAMDEGDLLGYDTVNISPSETEPSLTTKLIELSDTLLQKLIPKYLEGSISPEPQTTTDRAVSYSRKLTKQDGVLDFQKPAKQLEREIRAFITWPKSHTQIAGKDVVVLSASVDSNLNDEPGVISETVDQNICIYTAEGALIINELKPAGKPAMSASAFLAGHRRNLSI